MGKLRFAIIILFVASLVWVTPRCALGQATSLLSPRVNIRIVDRNRDVIPGAKVVFRNGNTSVVVAGVTDSNGEFAAGVPENEYIMTVSAEGFETRSINIPVRSAPAEPTEIVLEIATYGASVDVAAPGEYSTDAIASATKTSTPVRDIPQSVDVISRSQIADQALTGINGAVRYVPGVTVHQGENNRDQLIIRGQSSSADFYLDGARDDVQYYRDLYNLERVEVLKGPNALMFGRGGGGGVVNRVTKQAGGTPITEISVQGGMFGNKRIAADVERELNSKLAFRANGVFEDSESFRKFVGLRRFGFAPSISYVPNAKTSFTLSYERFRDRRVADRGITSFRGRPADIRRSTFFGDPENSLVRANADVVSAALKHEYRRLTLRNRTQYGDYDRFYQNYVPGAANPSGTAVTLTAYNNATRRRNLFNQTDVVTTAKTGNISHTLLGGFELGRQRSKNFRNTGFFKNSTTSIQVPLDDPTTSVPVNFRQAPSDADNTVRLALGAAYIQDQIAVGRFVQIVAGLRYDYFDLRYRNIRNSTDLRRIDRFLSPRVGVVVKPIEPVSFYTSYSVSYLPGSGDQFSSLTNVTQQVKPEKFTNYEIGLKWDVRRNFALTSAIYRLERTNTRATDPNDPSRIIQTGSQRSEGFELGTNGNFTSKWSVIGGYAYQNAAITNSTFAAAAGKQVAQVPHHSFTLWNKYQLMSKLGFGLGILSRSGMFAAVDNTVVLPGYTRADVALYYTFSEKWRLQANVENVLNRRYFANADGNTNISPGSPTSVTIGLIARF